MATHDIFLKLDGIDGEAKDADFKNQIDVLSFNYGATQGGNSHWGGGGGQGRVVIHDINIVKNQDTASPALFQYCCNGKHIDNAVLTQRKAGKDQQPFLIVSMTEVLISSYQTSSLHGDDPPVESVTLNFATMQIAYSEQTADGSVMGPIIKGWDAKGNRIL
jgi:type VI secretion system secreted protein Hcp